MWFAANLLTGLSMLLTPLFLVLQSSLPPSQAWPDSSWSPASSGKNQCMRSPSQTTDLQGKDKYSRLLDEFFFKSHLLGSSPVSNITRSMKASMCFYENVWSQLGISTCCSCYKAGHLKTLWWKALSTLFWIHQLDWLESLWLTKQRVMPSHPPRAYG